MIDWKKSAERNNTTVETLQKRFVRFPQSHKRVVVICEGCGKEREITYQARNHLCGFCARSGENNPNYGKSGENTSFYGKHHSEETRKKMSEVRTGKHPSEESRKNMSKAQSGENHPLYGKHRSEETRKKISEGLSGENNPMYGKHLPEETRKKISGALSGENAPNWKGGISFGKYCKLFNNSFKKSVRDNYHNTCFLCGKTKEEEGQNLSVHHVNYNKDCLCGSTCEFVPLCASCHSKTNHNREYWEDLIMHYLHPNRYFMTDI